MSGHPRLPLHVGDYLKDTPPVSRVSWEHHGIYMLALMITWNTPKCQIPNDPEWLAMRFGCTLDEYHEHVAPVLRTYFKCDGKFHRQKRLRQEHDYIAKRSRLQSQRAKALQRKKKEASRTGIPAQPESQSGSAPTPTPTIERKKGSVADATAHRAATRALVVEPIDDLKTTIWQAGLARLMALTGKAEPQCRRLVGKWCGEFGDEAVWAVLCLADRDRPVEPVSWCEGCLRYRAGKGKGQLNGYRGQDELMEVLDGIARQDRPDSPAVSGEDDGRLLAPAARSG